MYKGNAFQQYNLYFFSTYFSSTFTHHSWKTLNRAKPTTQHLLKYLGYRCNPHILLYILFIMFCILFYVFVASVHICLKSTIVGMECSRRKDPLRNWGTEHIVRGRKSCPEHPSEGDVTTHQYREENCLNAQTPITTVFVVIICE